VNKWDEALNKARRAEGLADGGQLGSKERRALIEKFTEDVRHEMIFAAYAPVVFISALKRKGIDELLNTVVDVSEQHAMRLSTVPPGAHTTVVLISEVVEDETALLSRLGQLQIMPGARITVLENPGDGSELQVNVVPRGEGGWTLAVPIEHDLAAKIWVRSA
jgi:hypothetical protein